MEKLTAEQSKLASDNHGLVFAFLNSRYFVSNEYTYKNNDDLYGIAAEGLCHAAATYDKNKNDSFAAYAYICMTNALTVAYKTNRRQKRIPVELIDYYDTPATDSLEDTKLDNLPAPNSTENEAVSNTYLDALFNSRDDKHKNVYRLILEGFSITEIAKKLGVSKQSISQMLQRDRKHVSV